MQEWKIDNASPLVFLSMFIYDFIRFLKLSFISFNHSIMLESTLNSIENAQCCVSKTAKIFVDI